VLVLAIVAGVAGCVLMNEVELYLDRPIKFNHSVHGEEQDLECVSCHASAEDSDEAGMPGPGTCRLCHTSKEDVENYLRPFVKDNKLNWTNVTDIPEEVKFSHAAHAGSDVGCEECHQGVSDSKAVSMKFRVGKDDCMSCHADQPVESECMTCHTEINKEWEPENHEHNWERMHGQTARSGLEPPYQNRCSLCHQQNECSSCHQDTEPRNHTNNWRLRGHGISARMDRESCMTCHRSDYCDRCHRETTPQSHAGPWGSPRNTHCYTCHLTRNDDGCNTCHKVMPSHLEVPRPDNVTHNTASEGACRTCHSSFGEPTHPDNGESCKICHR